MLKVQGRQDDGEDLSCGHYEAETDWAELLDRSEDEKLTCSRGYARDYIVPESRRVVSEELHDLGKLQ